MEKFRVLVDAFNALVRGLVTLGLTFGFVWGFVISKVVSVEAYIGIFGAVVAWWFASRVQQTRADDKPVINGPPPMITIGGTQAP